MSHCEKIWWLEDNCLGGMPKPPVEEIQNLYDKGLRAVASFLEEEDNIAEYKAAGLKVQHLPVVDDEAPRREQAEIFVSFVEECKAARLPLAVHCHGGNGRAGTMLAAYYVLSGREPAEVLSFMRSINPKAVRTQVQEDFLSTLAQG